MILSVKYINYMLLNMQITWQYSMLFKPPSYISTYLPSIDCKLMVLHVKYRHGILTHGKTCIDWNILIVLGQFILLSDYWINSCNIVASNINKQLVNVLLKKKIIDLILFSSVLFDWMMCKANWRFLMELRVINHSDVVNCWN